MKMIVPLFLLASLLVTSHGANYQKYPLRLKSDGGIIGSQYSDEVWCTSWRLAVELNAIQSFDSVPIECREYIGNYMLGDQYRSDSKTICVQAYYHARDFKLGDDGKDIFVFEVEDIALSSLPFNAANGFGVFNKTAWEEYVNQANAPALPETLKLYQKLLSLGVKVVFLTRRSDKHREATEANLEKVGFHSYHRLITRGLEYKDTPYHEYKAAEKKKLVEEGYRIIGNLGGWCDIISDFLAEGGRAFKLPNPMYSLL